jgi:hypothetical protein
VMMISLNAAIHDPFVYCCVTEAVTEIAPGGGLWGRPRGVCLVQHAIGW